ncbi:disease resistance protein RPV1-like isoform X3 [Argentina anserina]|uniref:disease resistance protein RPV1-like isoform X3 n=1 Tax=Argentina anserina TaxID=57926 RepID=UPI00217647B7|nr:disease resistance protein RPV1-like isoform X3 [Potentilla anserina]
MKRLRFLKLRNLEITGGYKYLPNKLECLDWLDFPLKSIPRDFNLGEVVAIYLRRSQLRYVWNDSRVLAKLKILDLSDSYFLKQSPEFSTIPNLEKLVFRHCHNLSEVHHSIGALGRLSTVDLAQCSSLKELPTSFYKLKSVVTLVLDRCVRFEKLDEEIGDMTSLSTLRVNETAITELPSSMVRLKNLRCVSLRPRSDMVRFENRECLCRTKSYSREYRSTRRLLLPPSVQGLSSLDTLRISDRDLTYVPKDLGSLASLKNLDLQFCTLQSLPSLSGLNRLVDLNLTGCNLTDEIIKIMDLGSLFSLKLLDLSRNSFTSLPSLCSLSKLKTLDLNYCENLVAIPKLPASLMMLEAKKCTALVIMPDFSSVCNMRRIRLLGCYKVVDVPGLDRSLKNTMRLLNMAGCNNITATLKEKILRVSLSLSLSLSSSIVNIWCRDGIS